MKLSHLFKKKLDINYDKWNLITSSIVEMIYKDFRPFSIVEDEGFKNLINSLELNYTIPSRKIFSSKFIPELYQSKKSLIKERIRMDNPKGFSFTTDTWTSKASGESFLR